MNELPDNLPAGLRNGVGDLGAVPDTHRAALHDLIICARHNQVALLRAHRVRDGKEVTLLVLRVSSTDLGGVNCTDVIPIAEIIDTEAMDKEYIPALPHYVLEANSDVIVMPEEPTL